MNKFKRNKRPESPVESVSEKTESSSEQRKPRILIAGEFSAGKTQLINGLIGHTVLPSNVTATALPPVWLVGGKTEALARVDLGKKTHKAEALAEATVEDTFFCLRATSAPVLERYDLIDTPGNSDPNIPPESWERMVEFADSVVWCTNATQAWRQSEKAVWDEMPDHLAGKATMLITHADRIIDARSAERVLRRVRREAGKYFSSFLMVSLIKENDIEIIARHLQGVAEGLEQPAGQPSLYTSNFLQDLPKFALPEQLAKPKPKPVAKAPAKKAAPVVPRRVFSEAKTPDVEFAADLANADVKTAATATSTRALMSAMPHEAESVDLVKSSVQSADVIDLAAVGAAKLSEQDSTDLGSTGRVRALWDTMVRNVDTGDPAALLSCVDNLISALDGPLAQSADTPFQSDDVSDAVQVALSMNRRTT